MVDKFNRLLFEKFHDSDTFYPRFCLGPATKNLSSKPLSSQQEKIISKVESGIMASIDKVEASQELRAEIVRKLNTFNMKKIENDITKNDIKILSDLKKDKVITITRTDKGNTIVIMDTVDYDLKMKTIILDTTIYNKTGFRSYG